jgi:hypothetical protein
MRLNAEQLKAFDAQGYCFFPDCFSEQEIALLRMEADAIRKLGRQEVWREKTGAPRKIVYLTLCAVANHITKFTRAEWIAHCDFTPIVPAEVDALIEYARARRMAAE